MISLQFPEPTFKIQQREGNEYIFDKLRKKWLALTPEEWVRQNILQYMQEVKKYPATMIAVEKELTRGELKKRFDILVYDHRHNPWLMVECKAMDVVLNEKTLEQILRYNISIPVNFIVISNGNSTYGWEITKGVLQLVDELPEWNNV